MLGAAMWQQPHILVLDEPTNYLDRESLGAMASAIKEYGGGVVIVSHHSEFVNQVRRALGVTACRGGALQAPAVHGWAWPCTRAVPCAVPLLCLALTLARYPWLPLRDRCALRSGTWAAASARSPASLRRPWRRR